MIYLVEMDFRDPAREADWHIWYLDHITSLIRHVPGFTATQRFRALTAMPSPWLALHEVNSPALFESKEYKSHGGPVSTGEWRERHTNWYRNVYAGIDKTPDVPIDGHLLMADEGAKVPASFTGKVTWLENVGLDRSTKGRGIAVIPAGKLTASLFDQPGIHLYKPITPRIPA